MAATLTPLTPLTSLRLLTAQATPSTANHISALQQRRIANAVTPWALHALGSTSVPASAASAPVRASAVSLPRYDNALLSGDYAHWLLVVAVREAAPSAAAQGCAAEPCLIGFEVASVLVKRGVDPRPLQLAIEQAAECHEFDTGGDTPKVKLAARLVPVDRDPALVLSQTRAQLMTQMMTQPMTQPITQPMTQPMTQLPANLRAQQAQQAAQPLMQPVAPLKIEAVARTTRGHLDQVQRLSVVVE